MKTINEYTLVEHAGAGSKATVWRAVRRGVKPCAIRLYSPDDEIEWASARAEIKAAMRLSHSVIAQAFDSGADEGRPWLACEWIDGVDLGKFSRDMRLRGVEWHLDLVAHVVGKVLEGLLYLERLDDEQQTFPGLAARTVRPSGVILSSVGEVKLTPSVLRGQGPTDLYSVGVLMQEMVDGVPFSHAGTAPPPCGRRLPQPLEELRRGLLNADTSKAIVSPRAALGILSRWPRYRPCSLSLGEWYAALYARWPRSGLTQHVIGRPTLTDGPIKWPLRHDTDVLPVLAEPDAPGYLRRARPAPPVSLREPMRAPRVVVKPPTDVMLPVLDDPPPAPRSRAQTSPDVAGIEPPAKSPKVKPFFARTPKVDA